MRFQSPAPPLIAKSKKTHHEGKAKDLKRKYTLLKVCYVPTACATFLVFLFSFFLAVAINSTNETNKAGGM